LGFAFLSPILEPFKSEQETTSLPPEMVHPDGGCFLLFRVAPAIFKVPNPDELELEKECLDIAEYLEKSPPPFSKGRRFS
jgi:hypothetical protein